MTTGLFTTNRTSILHRVRSRDERIAPPSFGPMLLATLASGILQIARYEFALFASWWVVSATFTLATPWLVWLAFSWMPTWGKRIHFLFPALFCFWILIPAIADWVTRSFGFGDSFEVTLLLCMQNAAALAAASGHQRRNQSIAVLISSFVTLYSVFLGSYRISYWLAGAYGILLIWWMMSNYWSRVERGLAATHTERCLPTRFMFLGTTLVVLCLGLVAGPILPAQVYSLQGFLPSSGGNQWRDSFARSGVGDGDLLVAAQDQANSFGAVESKVFLDSELSSLYDMYTEMYGDPPSPSKQRQKSVAIERDSILQSQSQTANAETTQREFSTIRRRSGTSKALADLNTDALFHCVGRVPLHLAIERYDNFDGREWTFAGNKMACLPIRLREDNGKTWAFLMGHDFNSLFHGRENHSLRIAKLNTNRFPSPPHIQSIHIDRIKHASFYGWTVDGSLQIPGVDRIPSTTVVHVESRRPSLESLREIDFTGKLAHVVTRASTTHFQESNSQSSRHEQFLQIGADERLISDTAQQWTTGIPRGWQQVEAITQRLRNDFVHDPEATAPEECKDVVAYFLENRSGPDYMFATTAAMLLRSLGYQTRMTTGFYADAANFDRAAQQTPVTKKDIHVWTEVRVDQFTWVPIEPTPGFAIPLEHISWRRRIAMMWTALLGATAKHGWLVLPLLIVGGLLFWTRLLWLDAVFVLIARVAGVGSMRRQLVWTIRLLEWRAWLARVPRPQSKTLTMWYGHLANSLPDEIAIRLREVLDLANRALYDGKQSFDSQCRIAVTRRTIERDIRVPILQASLALPTQQHKQQQVVALSNTSLPSKALS